MAEEFEGVEALEMEEASEGAVEFEVGEAFETVEVKDSFYHLDSRSPDLVAHLVHSVPE